MCPEPSQTTLLIQSLVKSTEKRIFHIPITLQTSCQHHMKFVYRFTAHILKKLKYNEYHMKCMISIFTYKQII